MSHLGANFPPPPDLTRYIARADHQYVAGGGFGDVYRCWYHDGSPKKEVAVKAFRFTFSIDGDANDRSTKMVRRELGIWRRLNHANVVPFIGFTYGFGMHGAMSLVSLWMRHGSLHHFLEKHADDLSVQHRLKFLLDIANGLCYLHSFPIVHGDLNCNNVLLDADYTVRLADFGYASLVGSIPEALTYLQRSTTHPGALRWSPPEQMEPKETFNRTTKSDIYSFGCIALQVLSGKPPWSEIREDMAVVLQMARGHKPSRPASCMLDDAHWGFIQQCWSAIEERPVAQVAVHAMEQFLSKYPTFRPLSDSLLSRPSRDDFAREPSSSTMEGSSTRVTHSANVKRPENAFILFRRQCCEAHQATIDEAAAADGPTKKQRQADLSKTISQQWKALSPEERLYWEELAKEKKKEHEQMYPNYVYRPQHYEIVATTCVESESNLARMTRYVAEPSGT